MIADSRQAAAQVPKKKNIAGIPLEQYRYSDTQSSLPLHAAMFEEHRLVYMKGVLRSLLYAELSYHSRVVEELSSLLENLNPSEEDNMTANVFVG